LLWRELSWSAKADCSFFLLLFGPALDRFRNWAAFEPSDSGATWDWKDFIFPNLTPE
jgi:hypothetical protein